MSDTLYIQTDENMEVHHPHVYLQDIVKLSCSNSKILNRLRVLPVASLDPKRPGRYVLSAMDLIREIQKKEPDLEITHIGEPSFIITYQTKPNTSTAWCWCKVIFVCLASFFGAAFSIMTFNNDVDVPALFRADRRTGHRPGWQFLSCTCYLLFRRHRSWCIIFLQSLRSYQADR